MKRICRHCSWVFETNDPTETVCLDCALWSFWHNDIYNTLEEKENDRPEEGAQNDGLEQDVNT